MLEKMQKCVDRITNEFTAGDYYREVYEAKKTYFESLGVLSEDDPDFENQMDVFMGWYVFDRPLAQHDLPPALLFFRRSQSTLTTEELPLYEAIIKNVHSVFEMLKQKGDLFSLRDLSTGNKFEVFDQHYKAGFSKGDIFEARLIPDAGRYLFAQGFCFHPKEAMKFIELQMKKIREEDVAQRTKLMLRLGQMKNKHKRFPHIDVQHIYTLTPKF
jgi:hypothetical protein